MLTLAPKHRDPAKAPSVAEGGFTLLEMMIATLVVGIMLAVGGSGLVSLNQTATRNDAMVADQQEVSGIVAQMERDIRSASSLSIPSGYSSSDALDLGVLEPDGTTLQNVRWLFDTAAGTLTREVETNGVYQPSGLEIGGPAATTTTAVTVANGASTPVFRYYDLNSDDISATTTSNIAMCATAVYVDVEVASGTSGVAPYQETAEVAITNQTNTLTAPGNGQCGG